MRQVVDRQLEAPPKTARVDTAVLDKRRVTVSELQQDLSLSHGTIRLLSN
jgi:hypothetical protein